MFITITYNIYLGKIVILFIYINLNRNKYINGKKGKYKNNYFFY